MVDELACEILNLDKKKIHKIAKELDNISRRVSKMGLTIFGGTGDGTLRSGSIIIHDISGLCYDGGAGDTEYYRGICLGETSGLMDWEKPRRLIDKGLERIGADAKDGGDA